MISLNELVVLHDSVRALINLLHYKKKKKSFAVALQSHMSCATS